MSEPKTMTETMILRDNRVRAVDDPKARKAAQEALEEYRKLGGTTLEEIKRECGIE